ncbi:hypothetical protein PISMIDRAFT_11741 [Pisolithus microcarpus 441]|uniref:Uncharacterized protein n=1 Tax=Pisolithus microcarpus 441 TaxID=765257 RepID=A0A0C9Z880_9AGAM|nr:hypothetical protein BKA83DRAFT_11741 [Pisolithus microcarpus]KIK22269.1 hypothetical protein PISMIDRAFT_11741 [Pisolithus microcarpus 441]
MQREDYNQATPNSTKLLHFHGEPTFGSMKRRRGNHDSTILQHLRPRDVETAVRTLAVGGPATSLMDDDVAGLKSEVAGSDKPPTNAEANAERDKNIGVDCAGGSESRSRLHRSSSG